jgi:hypothetical protein
MTNDELIARFRALLQVTQTNDVSHHPTKSMVRMARIQAISI